MRHSLMRHPQKPGCGPGLLSAPILALWICAAAWVATGPARAADGQWQQRPTGLLSPLSGVAYGTNRFVAVGSLVALGTFSNTVNHGIILTSDTGARWRSQPVPLNAMLRQSLMEPVPSWR